MPDKATVTPNALWPQATIGKVEPLVPPPQKQENVPIVVIPVCPAELTVEKSQYPTGVIILNENPIPNDAIPIEINCRKRPGPSELVKLSENVGWPFGEIVLWE